MDKTETLIVVTGIAGVSVVAMLLLYLSMKKQQVIYVNQPVVEQQQQPGQQGTGNGSQGLEVFVAPDGAVA